MDWEIPPLLGAEPEPTRRLPFHPSHKGDKETCSRKQTLKLPLLFLLKRRFASPVSSIDRDSCCLKHGRGPSRFASGGAAMAPVFRSAKSTCGWVVRGSS